jgi:predicted kinase
MTVGLPKSGKSTWAKQQNLPIVNPDSIRLAIHGNHFISEAEPVVWLIAKYMVKSLFLAGHDKVILDATNITKKRRDEWISKSWNIDFKLFTNVSIEECLTRAKIDNDLAIEAVIYRMANEYEPV